MDCKKVGALIWRLRKERGLTQRALAERLRVSAKAVSKWERGNGCPDVTLLAPLSEELGVDLAALLSGQLPDGEESGGNMKKATYYVCPACGAITMTTGEGELSCCGRRLTPLTPQKPDEAHQLRLERVEDEWFVTAGHPMEKEHFLSFAALASGDRVQLVRLYPEWDLQVRFPARGHGVLLWYCTRHGLFSQVVSGMPGR